MPLGKASYQCECKSLQYSENQVSSQHSRTSRTRKIFLNNSLILHLKGLYTWQYNEQPELLLTSRTSILLIIYACNYHEYRTICDPCHTIFPERQCSTLMKWLHELDLQIGCLESVAWFWQDRAVALKINSIKELPALVRNNLRQTQWAQAGYGCIDPNFCGLASAKELIPSNRSIQVGKVKLEMPAWSARYINLSKNLSHG